MTTCFESTFPVDRQLGFSVDAEISRGVVISEVDDASCGLEVGDRIIQMNG